MRGTAGSALECPSSQAMAADRHSARDGTMSQRSRGRLMAEANRPEGLGRRQVTRHRISVAARQLRSERIGLRHRQHRRRTRGSDPLRRHCGDSAASQSTLEPQGPAGVENGAAATPPRPPGRDWRGSGCPTRHARCKHRFECLSPSSSHHFGRFECAHRACRLPVGSGSWRPGPAQP